MTDRYDVFLSYSHNDRNAAAILHGQLEKLGLTVFWDEKGIRAGDLWLDELQNAVDGCGAFIVLVGRDGVGRWIGAETQVALNRYFGPRDNAERLPIFPVLLGETAADTLPAFLRLFQAEAWNGADSFPESFLKAVRERTVVPNETAPFEGCPFVGLSAFRPDQAHLFFGRQKETLDALARLNTRHEPIVRWLEINGNSGCGKSSLMNAGLLPLVEKGWLWRRTGCERWTCIEPMVPGKDPVEMLAECLARTAKKEMDETVKMGELVADLKGGDDALRFWLRQRNERGRAFLLAVDQFEELFTFAKEEERRHFDGLLAGALEDDDCPLFVISTMRADFLHRFDDLPRLNDARNHRGKPWTLAPIGPEGIREIIEGPAGLARLEVHEVTGMILQQAENEPGALPLVENALEWLWNNRSNSRLSERRFYKAGGLAGILSHNADALLKALGTDGRACALELLFHLVKVDPEGLRHSRQRMAMADAEKIAGGRDLVNRLAGQQVKGVTAGPARLITITDEGRWVNLIHETLIRSKGLDAGSKPQPYWPTLWNYIEQHKERAAWREKLRSDLRTWLEQDKAPGFLWSHERVRELHAVMQQSGPRFELNAVEREFLGPIDADEMLAALEKPETSHKDRLLIGERLDILGEHPSRWGVGVDADGTPRIDWRTIEGGEVTISIFSDPNDPRSKPRKTLPRSVKSFKIARYPVTVAQYRAFVEAKDGWRDPAWWDGDLYRDPEGNTYEFGRFGNHPAVYVSWFDAVAFCRWLSRRLGFVVRLPDEWIWQLAALGDDDGSAYPWRAGDWDPTQEPYRANTFESRLGQATAVGMYPAGASPQATLDMAGTVWECCLNKFDRPEVSESSNDDFDLRVLRGGSWNDVQGYARSAYRNGSLPDDRDGGIGFRVVCSSPSLDTDP